MYIEKLRERDRRKTVVKELGLVEAFFKVARLNHIWPSRTLLGPTNDKLNHTLLEQSGIYIGMKLAFLLN